jgi:hypothetical protein
VDLEVDGGEIRGEAAGTRFHVTTRGDELRGDGVSVDLRASPDDSVQGRYYLSWKKNSVIVQAWRVSTDRRFEGRVAATDRNVAIETAGDGSRTDSAHSWMDSANLDLEHSR